MISKIVALFFALLCISSTFFAKATIIQQGTQLRRIGSNRIYNSQGSINEEHHRKLQDEEEEDKDVADLLEEVAELLEDADEDEESGMPTYSPTKPETQEVRCVLCCYILLQCIRYVQLFTYTHS